MTDYLSCVFRIAVLTVLFTSEAPLANNNPLRFDRYSLKQGLSQGTVTCLLQDRQGFLWIGTQDGLNRFDGYRFKVFSHELKDSKTLSSSFIDALYEDHTGNLWVGTSQGLNRYDPATETFTQYKLSEENREYIGSQFVRELYPGPDNKIWVATHGGLFLFDPISHTSEHYYHQSNKPGSITSNRVYSFLLDNQDQFWVGTETGLDKFDDSTNSFIHFQNHTANVVNLGKISVTSLVQDKDNNIWIGTYNSGLYKLEPDSGSFTSFKHIPTDPYSLSHNRVRSLLVSSQGELWVGTRNGISLYDYKDNKFFRYNHEPANQLSLSNNNIWSIAEDFSGGIWFGTSNGLNHFDPRALQFGHQLKVTSNPGSLSHNVVRSLFKSEKGVVWIGVDNGLNRYDPVTQKYTNYLHDPKNKQTISRGMVMSILVDSKGRTWAGTYDDGLNLYDNTTGTFKQFKHDENNPKSLSGDRVYSIKEDSKGNLWIGTINGLNRFNPETGTFDRFQYDPENPESISDNGVYSTLEDPSGYIWIATRNGGLNRLNPTTGLIRRFMHNPDNNRSISHDRLFALYMSLDGILWVATKAGLNKFNPNSGEFTTYNKKHGLANDTIYAVAGDGQGFIWVSTNRGLARFNPKTESFRVYDESFGVQSNEFNNGAFFKASDGELFFGGINGYNRFYPENIKDNLEPPKLVITDFLLFNKTPGLSSENIDSPLHQAITLTDKLSLTHKDYVFSFELSALHYSSPLLNRYAYKLEGFDTQWNYTDAKYRRVTYTNLPPGSFTFRFMASNADNIWSDKEKRIAIIVHPAPWRTWWAYTIYFITVSLLLSLLVRKKLQQLAVERKTARAIALSEKRLSTALWGSRSEMWEWNILTGKIERDNLFPDVVKASGPARSPVDFVDLIHEDDRGSFICAMTEHLEGKNEFLEISYRLKTKSDEWRWILDRGKVVERDDGGNPVMMCGTLVDISELKYSELSRIQSIRKLVSGVAQEINTPLGVSITAAMLINKKLRNIVGTGNQAEEKLTSATELEDGLAYHCRIIETNLLKISASIQEFRKIAEFSNARSYAFNLAQFLNECREQFIRYDLRKKIDLQVECSQDILVLGEPLILRQVLEILYDNSIEHGFRNLNHGEIIIRSHITQGKVMLKFSDNGTGMEAQDLEKAFEPFFTTKRVGKHIGLGLHAAYALVVDELQGAISIETNEKSRGISVSIELKTA